jgi:hypothetical protein
MMRDLERLQATMVPTSTIATQPSDLPSSGMGLGNISLTGLSSGIPQGMPPPTFSPDMSSPNVLHSGMPQGMTMSGVPSHSVQQPFAPLGDVVMSDTPGGAPMAANATLHNPQMPQKPPINMAASPPMGAPAPTAPFPSMDDDEVMIISQSPAPSAMKMGSPALSKQASPRPGSSALTAKGKQPKGPPGALMLGQQVQNHGAMSQNPLGQSNFTNIQFTIATPAQAQSGGSGGGVGGNGGGGGGGGTPQSGIIRRPGMNESPVQANAGPVQGMAALAASGRHALNIDSVPTANMGDFGNMDADLGSLFGGNMSSDMNQQPQQPGQFDDTFFHLE